MSSSKDHFNQTGSYCFKLIIDKRHQFEVCTGKKKGMFVKCSAFQTYQGIWDKSNIT